MKGQVITVLIAAVLAMPVLGEVVEKKISFDDKLGTAVLYYDDAVTKPGPGIVVVHEWWGLDDYARGRARALAEAGYSAIAVDVYGHGRVADHPDNAKAFMEAALAEPVVVTARFNAARAALNQLPGVDAAQHYAIGYCFGGAVVLHQARAGADLAGVASFHGSLGTEAPAKPGIIKARILVATGADDPMVPVEQVSDFVLEMTTAGAELELLSFPGVVHSFTNPGATAKGKQYQMPLAYDAHADAVSWQALLDMLQGK